MSGNAWLGRRKAFLVAAPVWRIIYPSVFNDCRLCPRAVPWGADSSAAPASSPRAESR